MREKKKKVLMIGPSLKVQGGISAVAQKYFDNGICNYANIKYIATTVDSNKFVKAIFALFALLRVIILGPFYEVMHVHLASRNSFHRKFFFINYFFFLKKKVVVHLHGGEFDKFFLEECNERIKSRIRKVFLKSDKTIVLSKEWRKKLINIIGIEVDEKIIILPNAVNIPRYIPKNYKNNSMIFLGRLVPEKGLLEIFQGVAQIKEKYKDFSVTICGGGDIDKYIKICEELNILEYIKFTGWISGEDKEKLLRESTIFLLPSYNEGLPVSMLEAMSYGLACVVTNVGGIPSVINQNENGIMIMPRNINSFTEAVCSLLNNPQKKELLGKNAYSTIICDFNIEKNIESLIRIYDVL